jgi:hypothetical protein
MTRVTDTYFMDFARNLGWKRVKRQEHRVRLQIEGTRRISVARHVLYQSGSIDRLALLVSNTPCWSAMVWAPMYRLCSGWHIVNTDLPCESAAYRLDEWLNRRWFELEDRRREYGSLHPECLRSDRWQPPPYSIKIRRSNGKVRFVKCQVRRRV